MQYQELLKIRFWKRSSKGDTDNWSNTAEKWSAGSNWWTAGGAFPPDYCGRRPIYNADLQIPFICGGLKAEPGGRLEKSSLRRWQWRIATPGWHLSATTPATEEIWRRRNVITPLRRWQKRIVPRAVFISSLQQRERWRDLGNLFYLLRPEAKWGLDRGERERESSSKGERQQNPATVQFLKQEKETQKKKRIPLFFPVAGVWRQKDDDVEAPLQGHSAPFSLSS